MYCWSLAWNFLLIPRSRTFCCWRAVIPFIYLDLQFGMAVVFPVTSVFWWILGRVFDFLFVQVFSHCEDGSDGFWDIHMGKQENFCRIAEMVPHIHVLFLPLLGILPTFHGGFPSGSTIKNPHAIAGDAGLISGSGSSSGRGNGNLTQYSCLRSPMDRGA